MIRHAASAALLALLPALALADPSGVYRVDGTDGANQAAYQGTVTVERVGEKYSVVWSINGREIRGVALGGAFSEGAFMIGPAHRDDLMLAIGFSDGSAFGSATMFLQQDGSYEGFQVNSNGARSGQERWTPE